MKLKITLAALVLGLTPALASAMCSTRHDTASACAEGQIYDADTMTCIEPVSS
ncbi:MAG: hypothetical protein JJU07_12200 [Natronohydrobacter sp.]|nr:hypothetical protein [Natronohydrobacter sp.]MCC5966754.1 hypothetical protein [Natronohydrobacter sp.]